VAEHDPKVVTREGARALIAAAKAAGKRVVFANGCFDVLHGGHISYLEAARGAGDVLVVGLNSDTSVRGLKGPNRPLVAQDERAEILAALACVDAVLIFGEPDVNGLLEFLMPHVHSKGTDYTVDTVPERETAKRLGIETHIAGAAKQNDSRAIIGAMNDSQ
jgi:D-glycero-beta-D-manno-heptose 1-phosphate adenylyltransferase